jgi:polar amino acid transport system substrate-binding protein
MALPERRNREGCSPLKTAGLVSILTISALFLLAPEASSRSLEAIRTKGSLSICAHPNALPFASRKGDPPGIQVELAKALAQRLGVGMSVEWVIRGTQFRAADCDLVMDTIVDPESLEQRRLKVSIPYQRSGVALALRAAPEEPGVGGASTGGNSASASGTGGITPVRLSTAEVGTVGDLKAEHRVGVMQGSVAHMFLNQRGLRTIPFAFEDEMVEALDGGEIDAAAVSPATIGYWNLNHPKSRLRMVALDGDRESRLSWDIGVGMRLSDKPLRDEIDRAVAQLLADSTVQTIYNRYGIEHRAPERKD